MLEILYNTGTLGVLGWCGDPNQFGNFRPKPTETVEVWNIALPTTESDWWKVDLVNKTIMGNPGYGEVRLKRAEAQARAVQAINNNAGTSPWGQILKDMAVAQGLIGPE